MMKLLILLCALPLAGCMTLVSIPLDETLHLLVSGASEMMASTTADETPCQLRFPVQSVCIEYNRNVPMPELVVGIQKRLKQLQVESTLYDVGVMPLTCETSLRYSAARSWATHFTSSDKQSYLGDAELTLYQNGRVLSAVHYQTSRLGYEKWTSTATKMTPVVDELVCVARS